MVHDPASRSPALLPAGSPPQLLVVVDTEEEFDWRRFDRANTSVLAMAEVHRGQAVCERHGLRPTYVADYPVVSQRHGSEPLLALVRDARAEVGAHLHPWVNPPHEEPVDSFHSYPGNLPPSLERAKLAALADAIEHAFGVRPRVYKAGRYGIGPHSAAMLEDAGFDIDCSPCPAYDFRGDGGPDFSHEHAMPFWFGRARRMLCLPTTAAFLGPTGALAPRLWRAATAGVPSRLRLPGILSRLGVLSRIRLSPEGFDLPALQRLTRSLLARGQQVFALTYHSSTLRPGCTQYVRTERQRDAFLDVMNNYFAWFLRDLGGVATTPLQVFDRMRAERRAVAP
ncbi:MAG: polysaccharide deacetylase family protein [Planctomycetes bacterium]|jgi:hypothetical protein|nr:polysaccharide deacetylase family protein [Planctomycetota bacterium]